MTYSKTPLTHTFKVGTKYTCEMTMTFGAGGGVINALWDPYRPKRMTKREDRDYVRGRQELMTKFADASGKTVAVLDV